MHRSEMRAYGLAALVCLIVAGAALAAAPQISFPQSVTDARGRFTMDFPADWEVVTRAEGIVALLGAGPVNAGTRPTINVVSEPLTSPMTSEAYAAAAERLAKVALHNYSVVQESNATIRGRPAYYRYITWETNTGITLYQLQVFFAEGRTGYVVTGSTVNERERILHDMPLVQQIIETFRLASATN